MSGHKYKSATTLDSEVPDSNLGKETGYPDVLVVFLYLARKYPSYNT
jgi:hypothetical protein